MLDMLRIGKTALLVNQQNLDTTSHNIANINTPGYSRQRIIQTELSPINDGFASWGSGVEMQSISRIRDKQVDMQFWQENTNHSYWNTMADRLQKLEAEFLEPSDYGLSARLNQFWDSWEALADNPSGATGEIMRDSLIISTQSLTETFNRLDGAIEEKRIEINTDIEQSVNRINQISSEMAELNARIRIAEGNGNPASDLRDKFDLLMDELSEYGNTKLQIREDGSQIVYFGTDELVKLDQARKLTVQPVEYDGDIAGENKVVWADNFERVNTLNNGKIPALLSLRDEVMKDYNDKLDTLAVELSTKINSLHEQGFDLQDPPSNGHYFFSNEVTGAGDIKIANEIIDNPDFISASMGGEQGDNRVALEIADLRHDLTIDGKHSFNDYYGKLLYEVGNDSFLSQQQDEVLGATKEQLEGFRESVKGVSMDEETANLLKFQSSYQAAAKIVTMADSLLQTIIGMV